MLKKGLILIGKTLGVILAGVLASILASIIVPFALKFAPTPAEVQKATHMLLVSQIVYAAIFVYLIQNARIGGLKLAGALTLIFFGLQTFIMQLDTLIFKEAFPVFTHHDILMITLNGLVRVLIFVPLTVLIAGGWKKTMEVAEPVFVLKSKGLLWKVPVLGMIYVLVYYLFGFWVAWQFQAVRDFYAHSTVTTKILFLVPVQSFRGMLWALCGLPILVMMKKKRDIVIAFILLYGTLPSLQLIIPSPVMPAPVRMAHFIEITSSMILFGLAVCLVFMGNGKVKSGGS